MKKNKTSTRPFENLISALQAVQDLCDSAIESQNQGDKDGVAIKTSRILAALNEMPDRFIADLNKHRFDPADAAQRLNEVYGALVILIDSYYARKSRGMLNDKESVAQCIKEFVISLKYLTELLENGRKDAQIPSTSSISSAEHQLAMQLGD